MAALMRPEMGTVTNQAMKMLRNSRQSTAFLERSQPTDTTEPTCGTAPLSAAPPQHSLPPTAPLLCTAAAAPPPALLPALRFAALPEPRSASSHGPTLQCVVLMGRPTLEAITTVRADASSMLKPLQG